MYLPATIWATSLAGTGENPGPMMNGWSSKGDGSMAERSATLRVASFCKLETLRLETDADIEGFEKVETKEGTTILKEKAGLPCCESPVPAAKKLEAELPSDDETPPKHKFAIETETDEWGTSTAVDCVGVVETGGKPWADRSAANAAWTVCAMNEARAGEIPPSLPATTAWDVVGKSASDVTVCKVKGLKSLSPSAIEKTGAVCKLFFVEREPMAKYN